MEQHTYPKHNLILQLRAFERSNSQPFPAHKSILLDGGNDFINWQILDFLFWWQKVRRYIYFNYKKNLAPINLALVKE
jgi:hypothetical protein